MKKLLISSMSLVILLSFSIIGNAETKVSYDSNQSVGFTGIYSPPGEESSDNESPGLKDSEMQVLPQAVIPNAGDSSNVFPFLMAGFSALSAALLVKRLKKQEDYQ